MKLTWTSDIHLNFLLPSDRQRFYDKLAGTGPVIITGDIAESHDVLDMLAEMQDVVRRPIYFVAGNHDYYGSSIRKMRAKFKRCTVAHYLPVKPVKLDAQTILIGADGWGDGRNGDFGNSCLTMSDWLYIDELKKAYRTSRAELLTALQKIADADAERIGKTVIKALKDKAIKKIIIASHVPPLAEACLNAGKKSTPDGLCFFSSQIFEKVIVPIAENNPDIDFLWLSGHTHSKTSVQKRDNLLVQVAPSEYYFPQIAGEIEL